MLALLALVPLLSPADPGPDLVQVRLAGGAPAEVVRLAEALDAELERAVPLFERWTGRALPADARLVLHLHRDFDQYRAALRRAGLFRFHGTGAVTAWSTGESHVAVQPRPEPAYLDAVGGLPEMTLTLALHELVHQFVERSGAYPVEHQPLWYSEGMAEALAHRALRELRPDRPLLLADHSLAMLVDARASGELLPIAELFTDAFESTGFRGRLLAYAQSASVFEFLDDATNAPWSSRLDAFERRLGREPAPRRRTRATWSRRRLDRVLRSELLDLAELEAAWRDSLAAPSSWWLTKRAAEWVEDALVVASFVEGGEALCYSPGAFPAEGVAFEVELLPAGRSTAFLGLGMGTDPASRVELRFDAGGRLHLEDARSAADRASLVLGEALLPEPGEAFPVEVRVEGAVLRVRVAHGPLLEYPLRSPLPENRRFAFGTHDGAATFRLSERGPESLR